MTSALEGTDPVIFFESQRIYDKGEEFMAGGVPEGHFEIELGEPDVKKAGKDITILTIGATLYRALDAAKILEEKYGVSAEIIDARTIVPFNYDKVVAYAPTCWKSGYCIWMPGPIFCGGVMCCWRCV